MLDGILLTSELLAGALLLAAVVFAIVTLVRRRLIAGTTAPILCVLRVPGARWHSGLLTLTAQTLEWYPLFGLLPRPRHVWRRRSLEVADSVVADQSAGRGTLLGITSTVQVSFTADDPSAPAVFEIELASGAYTAVRAWLEAAPPVDQRFDS